MAKPPVQPLTVEKLLKLLDPGRVFYRVAVNEVLKSNDPAQIQGMLKGAKDVKAQYGDLDRLISNLESALKKAQG